MGIIHGSPTFNRMMSVRYVEEDGSPVKLPHTHVVSSHHVTVCFFFMSSGEMSWAWYVTPSYLLKSNQSPNNPNFICLFDLLVDVSSASQRTSHLTFMLVLSLPHFVCHRFRPSRESSFIYPSQLIHDLLKRNVE